jgi:hypothetical protein
MITFVLVQGARHGAWCWEPLTLSVESLEVPGGRSPFMARPLKLAELLITGCT